MLREEDIRPCEALDGAVRQPQAGEQFNWQLQWNRDGLNAVYDVPEDHMDRREKDWLDTWAREELRKIQERSRAGDRRPKTEIGILLHILGS